MNNSPEAVRTKIMNLVCELFDVTPEQLTGPVRSKLIHHARCVFSYLCRHHAGDTYMRIGMSLNKDHSSVIEQIEYMNNLIFMKHPTAKKMKQIESQLFTKNTL
jgi:chromosomal replication initiation ATPase DnaA